MNTADRIADLSMLWKQASLVFPYFDRKSIDWDRAYREYIPRVIAAETEREFHLLLAEFMNLLGDGHTDYLFPKTLLDEIGYLPFTLRTVKDAWCLDGVTQEHREHLYARINAVNGAPFEQLVRTAARYSYHVGNCLSRYRIHQLLPFFLKPTGNRMDTAAGSFSFDLCPEKPTGLFSRPLEPSEPYRTLRTGEPEIRLFRDGILCVRLDDFMHSGAADEVRAALEREPDVTGLILDLRENVGGMTVNGAKLAQLLLSGTFHACRKRTRSMTGVGLASASQIMQWSAQDVEQHIAAGHSTREEIEECKSYVDNTHCDEYVDTYGEEGHTALFDGPCVVLTSRHTVSAAEDFIAMLRTARRAVVVGTRTCGTTGTPLMQKLSCGGGMRVCSVGYRLLDGTEFVGCGIEPDVACEPSAEELRQGRDRVLDKALSLLRASATD